MLVVTSCPHPPPPPAACGPCCTNGTAQLGLAGRKCYRLLSPCLLHSVFTLSSTAPPCINSLFRILLMSVPGTTSRAPLMNNGGGTGSCLLPPWSVRISASTGGVVSSVPSFSPALLPHSPLLSAAGVSQTLVPGVAWVPLLCMKLGKCSSLTASALSLPLRLGPAME